MEFIVKRAETQEDFDNVYKLVHDAYVAEGYAQPQPDGKLKIYSHYDKIPETSVFIVVCDGCVVGTASMTRNNPSGLPMAEDFPEEVNKIRYSSIITGRYLCGCWRIATKAEFRGGLSLVLLLIKALFEECARYHIHEMIYVFNPKHVKFYEKMLGFRVVCERHVDAVDAPGVLMYSDGRHLAAKWLEICEKRNISSSGTVKDFWWPTASATPLSWWDIFKETPSLIGAIFAYPLLWAFMLYDKIFPCKEYNI